jgi:hypothetical protein
MKIIQLDRFTKTPFCPYGTFGILTVGNFRCYTVERPWENNKRNVSCIPEGTYEIELCHHHRGDYPTYEILDVPGRSLIKIDIANIMLDVVGCIGIGEGLGWAKTKTSKVPMWSVTHSKRTHKAFMEAMGYVVKAVIGIKRV